MKTTIDNQIEDLKRIRFLCKLSSEQMSKLNSDSQREVMKRLFCIMASIPVHERSRISLTDDDRLVIDGMMAALK